VRYDGRVSIKRIELQLEVSGGTHQRCALASQSLQGFDAGRVSRHELRQIDLDGEGFFRARFEQFGDLCDAQAASEPDKPSIGLLNNTDPAIHVVPRGKTQATAEWDAPTAERALSHSDPSLQSHRRS
jgi:hypothetical protein